MESGSEEFCQKTNSKRKLLFRATLDSININLRFQYNPSNKLKEQKSPTKMIRHGNITVRFQQNHSKNEIEVSNSPGDDLSDELIQKQIHNFEDKKQKNPSLQKLEEQIQKQTVLLYIPNKEGYNSQCFQPDKKKLITQLQQNEQRKTKKKTLSKNLKSRRGESDIFEEDQSNQFLRDDENQIYRKRRHIQKLNDIEQKSERVPKIQKRQGLIILPRLQESSIGKQDIEQKKKRKRAKKQGQTKKLDLSLLRQRSGSLALRSDEQDSYKPKSESQQMRLRTFRNRRIGVYIKRALRSAAELGTTSSIKQLLISVLRNYEGQLQCIRDEEKRIKRFQCLRRRIYQCLSVLSAVGLIDKRNKQVNGTKEICQQSQKLRHEKIRYREQIKLRQQKIKFKKQKYFDAVTRNRIIKSLFQRNKQNQLNESEKIYLPFKLIVGYRHKMVLKAQKVSNDDKFTSKITMTSQKYLRPIHSLDVFIMLRKIISPLKQLQCIQQLTNQYMESIDREDRYDENKKIRDDLVRKMKHRQLAKPGQKKKGKKNKALAASQQKSANLRSKRNVKLECKNSKI